MSNQLNACDKNPANEIALKKTTASASNSGRRRLEVDPLHAKAKAAVTDKIALAAV